MSTAAETMIELLGWADSKGRGFLAMKRTARGIIGASLLERDAAIHHVDNVHTVDEFLDEGFRNHAKARLSNGTGELLP